MIFKDVAMLIVDGVWNLCVHIQDRSTEHLRFCSHERLASVNCRAVCMCVEQAQQSGHAVELFAQS